VREVNFEKVTLLHGSPCSIEGHIERSPFQYTALNASTSQP